MFGWYCGHVSEGYQALRCARVLATNADEGAVSKDSKLGIANNNNIDNTRRHWVVSTRSITRWSIGGFLGLDALGQVNMSQPSGASCDMSFFLCCPERVGARLVVPL